MPDRMCAAPLVRRTEFEVLSDPVTGTNVRRFGTCGPRATASALSSALGHEVSLQTVYGYMRSASLCDESGASTSDENLHACEHFGAAVAENGGFHDISTGGWTGWLDFFRRHAGIDPLHFETSDGQALVDAITGLGENATNLAYHFPCVLGYHQGGVSDVAGGRQLPEGFWVADGDNFAGGNSGANGFNAANVLQFYTVQTIAAAKLVAGFALKGRNVSLDVSQVSTYFAANADGSWTCHQTGKTIHGGMLDFFRSFVGSGDLNGFSDAGLPLTDELPSGTLAGGVQPTIQVFERCAYRYDPNRAVDGPPGARGAVYKAHLNSKEVLAALGVSTSPPAPPSLTFGTATVTGPATDGTDVSFSIKVPYEVK